MPDNLPQQVDVQLPPETSSVVVAKVVYGLHALSIVIGVVTGGSILGAFLFGWPSIVAVILNYVMRSDAKGTYVESHFSWQIRTFWYAFGLPVWWGSSGSFFPSSTWAWPSGSSAFHHEHLGGLSHHSRCNPFVERQADLIVCGLVRRINPLV